MKKRIKNKITLPLTKKMILPVIAIAFMAVGYSAISTSFFLDGTLGIEQGLFDVRFTNVTVGGNDLTKDSVSEDGKNFTYLVTDNNRVTYEVTNLSKDYDVEVNVICSITPETIVFKNNFNNKSILIARTSRNGNVSITLPEISSEVITLTCVLDITGLERTEPGSENIEAEKVDYLRVAGSKSTSYLGQTLNRTKVESITLKDTKEVPEGIESWDVSNSKNGSILAYTLDEDSDSMLELYIGQNGGVKANPDASSLFSSFSYVNEIEGLENLDTSNVTDMGRMFYKCGTLTSLNLSGFNTSNVTDMDEMFYSCWKLSSLDLSNFNTSNAISMRSMFYRCGELTALDVSRFDTSKVTNIGSIFEQCDKLTSLDVSKFDTSNVTNMNRMFYNCGKLTSLDVSHFNTSKVTNMSAMFCLCKNLTSLDVSGFDTSNVTDMSGMFEQCNKLTSLDVSKFNTSNVKNMLAIFSKCYNLKSMDISKFDTSNVTNMSYMFENCISLTKLDLRNFNTNNVTDMTYMFSSCSLTNLDLSNFNTSNVTDMKYMFAYCSSLTNLDVSRFDTSNVTNMSYMFYGCSSLTSLDISNFDMSNVTSMSYMFASCRKLITTIPIRGTKCNSYSSMFSNAATEENAKITVNYTEDASNLVDQMIATKSSSSNVIKGTSLPKYTIAIDTSNITSDYTEAYDLTKITLSSEEENKIVTSFKLNGTLINGNTFTMPNENVTITDVVTATGAIIESEHNPYPNSLNSKVMGEETFEGVTSLTVILDYETESISYDYIYLYDSTGKQYGKYGGTIRKTETITISGNYIKVVFKTDSSGNNYYGFKATIVPNYD